MTLNDSQLQQFRRDGYLFLPGIIPDTTRDTAIQAINASIGEGMNVSDLPVFRSRGFCPDISRTSVISDLVNATPILAMAEQMIGVGRVQPVVGGQVALRFPSLPTNPPTPPRPPGPHLDGMYTPTNGVQKGSIDNFTALVGVFLSHVPGDFCGNLTIWPGSHVKYAAYFREKGAQALLDGMPPIDPGPGIQVKAKPGDAIIAHYLLGHGITPNVSPHVRYACFFRLRSVDLEQRRRETMQDPWLDWDGMRDLSE